MTASLPPAQLNPHRPILASCIERQDPRLLSRHLEAKTQIDLRTPTQQLSPQFQLHPRILSSFASLANIRRGYQPV